MHAMRSFALCAVLSLQLVASFTAPMRTLHRSHLYSKPPIRSCLKAAIEDHEVAYFDMTSEDTPTLGAKTRELPIFPLQMVTCPTGKCPLHIFEMRYAVCNINVCINAPQQLLNAICTAAACDTGIDK